jgi:Flp pilus assembly protein TadD
VNTGAGQGCVAWAARVRFLTEARLEDAGSGAREAVAITDQTQQLTYRADSRVDLGAVLELIGKPEEARAALAQALELYERKGNIVMAERTRTRLSAASRSA